MCCLSAGLNLYKPILVISLIPYFPTLAEYISMYSPFLFVPLLPHPGTRDGEEEYIEDGAFDPDDVY